MLTTTWQDNFYIAGFDYASGNPHQAYVISNLESNTDELILYDFETNKELKKVFSNPTFDVGGMSRSKLRNYEIDYYYFNGEKSTTIPVSDAYKKMHEKFQNQFGDKEFNISSVTDKEDKYLIYVTSDKLYGKYFTYDVNEDAFKEIMDLMPQLEEDNMAAMRSLKFKTRDGLTIYAYLTLPNTTLTGAKVPLIVNPHGGPYGPRDSWGFNSDWRNRKTLSTRCCFRVWWVWKCFLLID